MTFQKVPYHACLPGSGPGWQPNLHSDLASSAAKTTCTPVTQALTVCVPAIYVGKDDRNMWKAMCLEAAAIEATVRWQRYCTEDVSSNLQLHILPEALSNVSLL